MKILITGSRGFVGKETVKLLEEKGHTIIHYDIMDGYDICNEQQLEAVIKEHKPDRILHLAATARFAEADKDPEYAFNNNAYGTKVVAQLAGKYNIPIVYSSTGSVYMPVVQEMPLTEEFPGRGNSVYGCSKFLGECFIRRYAKPWIILRYGHLYGKEKRYHGLIGGFLAKILVGQSPILFGGAQTNDFAYVKDIAQANWKALISPWDNWNTEYNIGTGEELSALEAGKIICEYMGFTGEIEVRKGRDVDPQRFVYDISKARFMLGYEPQYTFREGLEDMLSDLKTGTTDALKDISKMGSTPGVIKALRQEKANA